MTRSIAIAILVALGCSSGHDAPPPPPSGDAWAHIAELAKPKVEAGPTEDLVAALAIVTQNQQAWEDIIRANKLAPLSAFPNGGDAVIHLVLWSRANGGFTRPPTLADADTIRMGMLGSLAIRSGGDGLRAGTYLGDRLLTEGNGLTDAIAGAVLLEQSRDKASHDEHPAPLPARSDGELVRIIAAAVLRDKQQRIWVTLLDGAKAGEANKITLDRVHHAATNEPVEKEIVHAIDLVAKQLDELH